MTINWETVKRAPLYEAFSGILFVYGLGWGILTAVGDRPRWSGPAFHYARDFAGGPVSWGGSFIVFCLVGFLGVVFGSRTVVQAASVASLLWSLAFAATLGLAAWHDPSASLTGFWTWGFHGVLFLIAARRARWETP